MGYLFLFCSGGRGSHVKPQELTPPRGALLDRAPHPSHSVRRRPCDAYNINCYVDPKCRPRGGPLSATLGCRPRETLVSPLRTAVVCQFGPLGPFIPHQLGREWEGKSKESARPSTPLEPKWPRVACTAALYQPSPHPVGAVPPLGGGLGAPNSLGLPKPPIPEGGPPLRAHTRTHPPAVRSGTTELGGG